MGQKKLSDEYEVTNILGRGGFSVVRKGKKKSTADPEHIHVAIKTLRRIKSSDSPGQMQLQSGAFPSFKQVSVSDALLTNEIPVMRKFVEDVLPHPNVIQLYDVCEDFTGAHLILELCSGGELFDRFVAQSKYTEVEAAAVVRQIAGGLAALHQANIIHRDLKSGNCSFLNDSEDSPLKIMDFGLSSKISTICSLDSANYLHNLLVTNLLWENKFESLNA